MTEIEPCSELNEPEQFAKLNSLNKVKSIKK